MPKRRRKTHEPELPIWDTILRRWRWGGLTLLVCLTPAATVVLTLPDVYRATATVLIERQQIPDELVRSTVTSALETRLHTITQQILSRPQLEDLIARFALGEGTAEGESRDRLIERTRSAIQVALESSKVRADRTGTAAVAFTVSYSGREPEKIARVANTLASAFVEENLKMRRQEASGTADFLRQQLDATTRKLESQEQKVSAFKERHAGELPEQLEANLRTLEQLTAQMRLNNENQIRANEQHSALEKQLGESEGMASAGGPDAAGSRLMQLRQTLAVLQARYSDRYPDVIRVKSEIESLEASLNGGFGGGQPVKKIPDGNPLSFQLRQSVDAVDVELKRLRAEEANLRQSLVVYQQRVEMAPKREQESQALTRDYETTKELYRSLVAKERDSQLAEDMEQRRKGEQFRVIEPALPPARPASPRRMRLLLLAIPCAVVLAGAVMLVLELADGSLHTAGQLQSICRIPVVASIPGIIVAADVRRRRIRFGLTVVAVAFGILAIFTVSYAVARENFALTGALLRLNS